MGWRIEAPTSGGWVIDTLRGGKVVRGLFVAGDAQRCDTWIARAGLSLALNAAAVSTFRNALVHLAEEPVDVVVLGTTTDGLAGDMLLELRARHATLPIVAIAESNDAVAALLDRGAFDVLLEDETPRLGATLLRAVREVELGRALRTAHDELQGVLSESDRQIDLLGNAPALLWSTDDALTIRNVSGASATSEAIGRSVPAWDDHATDDARMRMVDAHRRALAGETTTIHIVWLG